MNLWRLHEPTGTWAGSFAEWMNRTVVVPGTRQRQRHSQVYEGNWVQRGHISEMSTHRLALSGLAAIPLLMHRLQRLLQVVQFNLDSIIH